MVLAASPVGVAITKTSLESIHIKDLKNVHTLLHKKFHYGNPP